MNNHISVSGKIKHCLIHKGKVYALVFVSKSGTVAGELPFPITVHFHKLEILYGLLVDRS